MATIAATVLCSYGSAQINLPFLGNVIERYKFNYVQIISDDIVVFIGNDENHTPSIRSSDSLKLITNLNNQTIYRRGYCSLSISPNGQYLAIGLSDGVVVIDKTTNETLLDFKSKCLGTAFLDDNRLLTPSGLVLVKEKSQDLTNIPSMEIIKKDGDYLITVNGDVYNTRTDKFSFKHNGVIEGPIFKNQMLFSIGDGKYNVVNWNTGNIVADLSISDDVRFIGILDSNNIVYTNQTGIYIYTLSNNSAKLFTNQAISDDFFPTVLDPTHRRLFISQGTVINFK